MSRHFRIVLAALLTAGFTAALSAAPPVFWTVSTQADFLKGTVDGVAIDADGRLTLGPAAASLADPKEPFVWSLTQSGSSWFAGTGNDGKVLKIDANGASSVAFDAAELGVHAVIPDGRGGFYAATGPDGRVHHVDANGKASVTFDPADKYIWSLARASDGTLYVGTGDKGVIYRVRPNGESDTFYRTRSANVISLAIDQQGRLFAGTSTPGRLFRLDTAGKAFVVLDSPHTEVRGLRVGRNGELYAAALTPAAGDDNSSDAGTVGTVTAQVGGVTVGESSGGQTVTGSGSSDSRRSGRGAVYVVRDERADVLWETGTETPYDLMPGTTPGSLLVATGPNGRLYELQTGATPVRVLLAARIDARQITQLASNQSNEIVLAGSNPGRLLRLTPRPAAKGTFESEIRDAGASARWGSIRWRGNNTGTIQLSTRSGNTSKPDDTWSDWSAPYTAADGAPITSPSARYLQWRAVLTGAADASPVLTSVTVAYLPRNVRPVVNSLTVHPAGVVFQRPFASNEAEIAGFETSADDDGDEGGASRQITGRRMQRKGLQTFQWRADDPNGDRLSFTVSYRREGESAWRVLRSGLSTPIVVWDTTSVPDGRYVVRVTASDSPVNAPGEALEGTRDSDGFDIDNSAPVINVAPATNGSSIVRVTVRDAHSGVSRVEFALGGDKWQVVYPVDGLSDSREEVFEIRLASPADRARLVIRATDVLQNIATLTIEDRR